MSNDSVWPSDRLLAICNEVGELHNDVKDVRAGVKELCEELAKTYARLAETNAKLDRLDRRVTEGFVETNTNLAELSLRVGKLEDFLGTITAGQSGSGGFHV
ncbi:MAG: hypothetical protein QM765_06705 [Myxococcales bacterium]